MHWHQLLTDPRQLGDDRIFYPLRDTAYFKDLELAALPVYGLVYALTGKVIGAGSYTALFAMAAQAVATAALAQRWTGDRLAALTAGIVAGFSPIVLSYLGHYQLLFSCWMPLTLLAVDSFLRRPRWVSALAAVVFVWLQFVTAVYLAFYAVMAAAIYVAVFALWAMRARYPLVVPAGGRMVSARVLGQAVLVCAIAGILFVVPVSGYQRQARTWESQRTLEDVLQFSASPLSFLNPADVSMLYGGGVLRSFAADAIGDHEKRLFPGLVPVLLAGVGAWRLWSDRGSAWLRLRVVVALAIVVTGAALALGPYPVMNGRVAPIPLPYLAFYELVPGFQAMRTPARFGLMALLGLALLAAFGVAALRARPRTRWFAPAAVALLVGELTTTRIPMSPPLDVFPRGDLAALSSGEGPLVWLPVEGPKVGALLAYVEAARMLQAPLDRPLVNGYSGFIPPPYLDVRRLTALEDPAVVVAVLRRLGVRTLVLDPVRMEDARLSEWRAESRMLPAAGPSERLLAFDLPAADGAPSSPRLTVVNDRLRSGSTETLWFDLVGSPTDVWVNPHADARASVDVRWEAADGQLLGGASARAVLPLYVPPGGVRSFGAEVVAPNTPGTSRLRVRIADMEAGRQVELSANAVPTSKGPAPDLRAVLELTRVSPGTSGLAPSAVLRLHGWVENRGESTWLARPLGAPNGTVRVGARFFPAQPGAPPVREQRIELERDVPAGSTAAFAGLLQAPDAPGAYELRVGVVADGVAWLDEQPRGRGAAVPLTISR